MSAARSIAAAARAAAANRTVQALAASAGAAAAKHASQRYGVWRERRAARDVAIKLARQMGAKVSEDTIIGGRPHVVVWKEGAPVAAFPPVEDLANRPELAGFDLRLATEPPPLRPRRRLPGRAT